MDVLSAMTTSPRACPEPVISALAQRLHVPVSDVGAIYAKELARLAADARIEGFLSVLALRNTREILQDPAHRHFA
jgi:hypothetical protein